MDNLSHMTDPELVACYSAGCDEAFDMLLCRHKNDLYSYISYNLTDYTITVDDVFQETFVRVIVSIREGRYTPSGSFLAWLTRIARNIIVDNYRADNQIPTIACDAGTHDLLNDRSVAETYAEARIVNEQTFHDVKRLMESLPEQQREVVFLRYYENRSFKEIAQITGASVNTCLGRMRYGLINMRRMAEEHHLTLELVS